MQIIYDNYDSSEISMSKKNENELSLHNDKVCRLEPKLTLLDLINLRQIDYVLISRGHTKSGPAYRIQFFTGMDRVRRSPYDDGGGDVSGLHHVSPASPQGSRLPDQSFLGTVVLDR